MRIVKIFFILLITITLSSAPGAAFAKELVLYSFEKDPQGWEIPDWAFKKKDYVAEEMGVSEFQAGEGKYSLEVGVNFQGEPEWRGAYVERVIDITDWSPFNYLSADIFLPRDAPRGLRARIILTVGEEWKWTEMNRTIPLTPGEWTVMRVDLTQNSSSWRKYITDEFRSDVRKLGLRVESNGKIIYKGPIYIDNVKLSD